MKLGSSLWSTRQAAKQQSRSAGGLLVATCGDDWGPITRMINRKKDSSLPGDAPTKREGGGRAGDEHKYAEDESMPASNKVVQKRARRYSCSCLREYPV